MLRVNWWLITTVGPVFLLYRRTGKRMDVKSTNIVVQFKDIPMNLYYKTEKRWTRIFSSSISSLTGYLLILKCQKIRDDINTKPIKTTVEQRDRTHQFSRGIWKAIVWQHARGCYKLYALGRGCPLMEVRRYHFQCMLENTKDMIFP